MFYTPFLDQCLENPTGGCFVQASLRGKQRERNTAGGFAELIQNLDCSSQGLNSKSLCCPVVSHCGILFRIAKHYKPETRKVKGLLMQGVSNLTGIGNHRGEPDRSVEHA